MRTAAVAWAQRAWVKNLMAGAVGVGDGKILLHLGKEKHDSGTQFCSRGGVHQC